MKRALILCATLVLSSCISKDRLYYTLTGAGDKKTIILIHGYGATSTVWDQLVPDLAQEYHVLTLDLPGHGKSYTPQTYSLEGFVDDIHTLITKLNISNPIIVGWSLGGSIALYYALQHPIEKLVLIGSAPTWLSEEGFSYGSTKKQLEDSKQKLLTNSTDYYEDLVKANFTDECPKEFLEPLKERFRNMLKAQNPEALASILDYFISCKRAG